jgi:hypothetical protein
MKLNHIQRDLVAFREPVTFTSLQVELLFVF